MESTERTLDVFIQCMTYNHVHYIEDAMHGFVMQKADFPYVAAVVDDASTDGEPEVIKRFLEKEFDMASSVQDETEDYVRVVAKHKTNVNCTFVVVFLKYNHYSIKKRKLPYFKEWHDNAKYIALCEGDDYWTDPYKLQKQVDFLEGHEDYSMCFHAAEVLLQGVDASRKCIRCEDIENREYTSVELFSTWIVPTASMLFCREIVDSFRIRHPEWLTRGDIALVLKCSHVGKVMGMADKMSVYRMQPNSVTYNSNMKSKEMLRLPKHFICLYRNFPRVDRHSLSWCISQSYYSRMKMMRNPLRKICDCLLAFYWNPGFVWSKIKKL